MQYLCSLHDDDDPRPALISVMSVPTGETINVCGDCQPTWALLFAGVPLELVDQALKSLRELTPQPAPSAQEQEQIAEYERLGGDPEPEPDTPAPGLSGPHSAEAQEARVSADLAARPDSPATSEAAGIGVPDE